MTSERYTMRQIRINLDLWVRCTRTFELVERLSYVEFVCPSPLLATFLSAVFFFFLRLLPFNDAQALQYLTLHSFRHRRTTGPAPVPVQTIHDPTYPGAEEHQRSTFSKRSGIKIVQPARSPLRAPNSLRSRTTMSMVTQRRRSTRSLI